MNVTTTRGSDVWIVCNAAWNVFNFRPGLIQALLAGGHSITVCCPADDYLERLKSLGIRHVNLRLDAAGVNPLREMAVLLQLFTLFRAFRPTVLLSFTPKVNIYVSLVAGWLKIPVIANISGLGRAFIAGGWLEFVARRLYRLALRTPRTVFFQNFNDFDLFVRSGLVRREVCETIPGSGIDLERFAPRPPATPATEGFRFLLVGRMLWDKGVQEYVDAAVLVKARFPDVQFGLLGFVDASHPSAISRAQIDAWHAAGIVQYHGSAEDVRATMAAAQCVVLPSYREGTPRSLLEAASMEIPVIATDAVGCRDAVDDQASGYLCRPKDSADLAEKMFRMLALDEEARREMGRRGRQKMRREFDQAIVLQRYLHALKDIAGARN